MPEKYIQIDPRDNIIVAMQDMAAGSMVNVADKNFELLEAVRGKHKFALNDMEPGDEVIMYGVLVGKATRSIARGMAINRENIVHASAEYEDTSAKYHWEPPDISRFKGRTFDGYHRADGSVGTANHWLVIPLVFCENRNVEVLEAALSDALGYHTMKDFALDTNILVRKYQEGASMSELYQTPIFSSPEERSKNRVFPNVDGIKFLKHDGGCGGVREDSETLCNLLAGYITNPNVAGATVLSLGCQHAQIDLLKEAIAKREDDFSKPLVFLEQQGGLSERQFIEEAVKKTFLGLIEADKCVRSPAPLNKLTVGLECGGSDGFSGISANPALGYASDMLVALGGTAVLSEFPELNGVEQELINRCQSREAARKFAGLMRSYSRAAVAVGSGFENNPSPGNIREGLITDAIKSAGAAKKGGTSPVVDVLDYTEKITHPGLNLLCTPGNDVESTTGLAGSGCNIIVFTTGLGTPTGNPVTPVIKLSSNSSLKEKMGDLIDIDAGSIIRGEETIEGMGEKILDFIIDVASGKIMTRAERNGQNDFIPWKRGVSL